MDIIQNLQMELRFLKMFSVCLKKFEETGTDNNIHVSPIMIGIETLQKEAEIPESNVQDMGSPVSDLLEKIQSLKREIKEISLLLLDCPLQYSKSSNAEEMLEFIDSILMNLKAVFKLKSDVLGDNLSKNFRAIQDQLSFLEKFVGFTEKRCFDLNALEDFKAFMGDWVNKVAILCMFYWIIQEKDGKISSRLEIMLSDLSRKVKLCTPKVAEMYVAVLKASKSTRSDKFLAGQVVTSFFQLLLQDLMVNVKDSVDFLQERLVFMITLVIDPPEECAGDAGNVFSDRIDAKINEAISLICSLYIDETEENISAERRTHLSRIEEEMKKIEADAREVYVQYQALSRINFPSTNGMGFIDFLIGNLEEMLKDGVTCPPFAKHRVSAIKGELLSLRSFLKNMMELQQNDQEDLKEIWKRTINVTYKAEHAINSCLIIDEPIWYNMISLADVLEEMKLIKIVLKKINFEQMQKPAMLGSYMNQSSNQFLSGRLNTSRLEDAVVGYKDEAETIINRLTRGSKQLDIVSIVGMPGLGKTTLAKKVYNDPAVQRYFNRCAWCCISQAYRIREVLLDLISDVTASDARVSSSSSSDDDLVEKLRRSLLRQSYLIVMDDMWDIGAWDFLKCSFPDDKKGSRIIFTSRIHNLASLAKQDCRPHTLRPLSEEESWGLLEHKLFGKAGCPAELLEAGKRIATNCKGLALSVVLVAGILAGKNKNLDWWLQVESSIASQVASQGCMDILQLSYKQLPCYLRPCFLYFAAFPEDTAIGVEKLMRLWIAQGFIQRVEGKSLEDLAQVYLMDLISRSLVVVAQRSSMGRIRTCRVHDLVRELCMVKVKDENFLHWVHEDDVAQNLDDPREYDQYRLCIDSEWTHFTNFSSRGRIVNSLQLFGSYERFEPHANPSSFFSNFRLLKVLNLECLYLEPSFFEETTLITPLRYLGLWCPVKNVPSSIANLRHLETFIVKGAQLEVPLPDSFWEIKSLSYVAVEGINVISFTDSDGESIQLDNVVAFSKPTLAYGRNSEELMRRLPNLKKLNCEFFEPQYDPLKPILFPKFSLLSSLETLKIFSYGMVFYGENRDQFPVFDLPKTLKKLTLGRFTFPWSAIKVIGQLPLLEVLKLRRNAFSGPRWDVEDGEFKKLKVLTLRQMDIQEWSVSSEAFPCLEQLFLRDCYNLGEIPSAIGEIPTLEKLVVRWCFNAVSSAKQILEEQGNDAFEVLIWT